MNEQFVWALATINGLYGRIGPGPTHWFQSIPAGGSLLAGCRSLDALIAVRKVRTTAIWPSRPTDPFDDAAVVGAGVDLSADLRDHLVLFRRAAHGERFVQYIVIGFCT